MSTLSAAAVGADSASEAEFVAAFRVFRQELHAHCYRMVGSLQDAEDLVQETFLRAWRARNSFGHRASMRTWLYRIATNACLDVLAQRRRRGLPNDGAAAAPAGPELSSLPEEAWVQPYPGRLLELADVTGAGPETVVVARETLELAFVVALQRLSARQRAILVLRDVVGWSAADVAAALDTSTAAVNSGSQRARAAMRELLGNRAGWSRLATLSAADRRTVAAFLAALERGDAAAISDLLVPDARGAMPPYPMWYEGRDAIVATLARGFALFGPFAVLPTNANGAPAVALYRPPKIGTESDGSDGSKFVGVSVLTMRDGRIAEITTFMDHGLHAWFALPPALDCATGGCDGGPAMIIAPPVV